MDKLTVISGILFITAEVFAVASLAHPDWINTGPDAASTWVASDVSQCLMAMQIFQPFIATGAITLGLTKHCQTIYGRERTCFPPTLPPEWVATLIFLSAGIVCLAATCCFIVSSHWFRSNLIYARWAAFLSICCLCHVGMLFPIGFRQLAVGGEVFKLTNLWQLGDSYKLLWVFAIILSCSGWCMLMMPMRIWLLNR